jgi:hypothetical protein
MLRLCACPQGGLASMGCGLPAAIGAALANPQATCLAICGDGGFAMTSQELMMAKVYKLNVKVSDIMSKSYRVLLSNHPRLQTTSTTATSITSKLACLGSQWEAHDGKGLQAQRQGECVHFTYCGVSTSSTSRWVLTSSITVRVNSWLVATCTMIYGR